MINLSINGESIEKLNQDFDLSFGEMHSESVTTTNLKLYFSDQEGVDEWNEMVLKACSK